MPSLYPDDDDGDDDDAVAVAAAVAGRDPASVEQSPGDHLPTGYRDSATSRNLHLIVVVACDRLGLGPWATNMSGNEKMPVPRSRLLSLLTHTTKEERKKKGRRITRKVYGALFTGWIESLRGCRF